MPSNKSARYRHLGALENGRISHLPVAFQKQVAQISFFSLKKISIYLKNTVDKNYISWYRIINDQILKKRKQNWISETKEIHQTFIKAFSNTRLEYIIPASLLSEKESIQFDIFIYWFRLSFLLMKFHNQTGIRKEWYIAITFILCTTKILFKTVAMLIWEYNKWILLSY